MPDGPAGPSLPMPLGVSSAVWTPSVLPLLPQPMIRTSGSRASARLAKRDAAAGGAKTVGVARTGGQHEFRFSMEQLDDSMTMR